MQRGRPSLPQIKPPVIDSQILALFSSPGLLRRVFLKRHAMQLNYTSTQRAFLLLLDPLSLCSFPVTTAPLVPFSSVLLVAVS